MIPSHHCYWTQWTQGYTWHGRLWGSLVTESTISDLTWRYPPIAQIKFKYLPPPNIATNSEFHLHYVLTKNDSNTRALIS